MIGLLKGTIEYKTDKYLVLNAAGVGYKVYGSANTLKQAGEVGSPAKLYTHLYIRENILDLYGFAAQEDLAFFEQLISVKGIGPKAGLSVMMLASTKTLKEAISSGQKSLLTKVSGIGSKTAERILLELKDKVFAPVEDVKQLSVDSEALDALTSLGYTVGQARDALKNVPKSAVKVEDRVKHALKSLGTSSK